MRIQIELNERGDEILAEIKAAVRNPSMSHRELFENAITLLQWGIQQRQQGRTIASLDERDKNYKELIMPILEAVKPLEAKARAAAAG